MTLNLIMVGLISNDVALCTHLTVKTIFWLSILCGKALLFWKFIHSYWWTNQIFWINILLICTFQENSETLRENLERIVGTDDSTFSGIDLATLIRNKYGRSYDVQLIKKVWRFIWTQLCYLQIWMHYEHN